MLFNSYVFIFAFLPITVLGFALLGQLNIRRAGVVWLILCSAVFYAWWSPWYLALLIVSMLVNYGIGTFWLANPSRPARKTGLILGLCFNLIALAYFKYANLVIQTIDHLTPLGIGVRDIILPLGISFFTFQKIAYLVDVYRGHGYSRNFLDYCLFVLFFPQLIAGPIVHPREMLPQLSRKRGFGITTKNLAIGLTLFILGLGKKVVIADAIAPTASRAFAAAASDTPNEFTTAWLGILAYTLQIYFDFSGYSDMAIGLARMFGVRLPLNFNSPYKARNISDFWRRWHMTLSRFLRDYLYIPLGGNRKGPIRRYANLMITMLLGGLWHGASWTFMFWGGLHGIYLIIHHGWQARGRSSESLSPVAKILAQGITFLAVMVAWVFFRAPSFSSAVSFLGSMAGLHGLDFARIWQSRGLWLFIIALLAVVFVAPNTQQMLASVRPALGVLPPAPTQRPRHPQWEPSPAWAIALGVLAVAGIILLSRASEFIYYQF